MSLVMQSAKLNRALVGTARAVPMAPTALPGGYPTSLALVKSGVSANLGSIISGIGKIAIGYTQGGAGGAVQALGGILGGGSKPGSGPTTPTAIGTGHGVATTGTAGGGCVTVLGQQICLGGSAGAGSQFTAGGGTGIVTTPTTGTGFMTTPSGQTVVQKGYHLNKRGYFTKAGYVAPHSKAVKNRRRNPLNPRALSKALHRMTGFEKAAVRIEKSLVKVARRHAPKRRELPIRGGRAPRVTAKLLTPGCGCD